MSFKKEHRLETIIYLGLWGMLFLAPVISLSIRTSQTDGQTFDWNEIFTVWKEYAVFFVVFLIHNHLLAPMLVYRQKIWHYLALCLAIVVIFQTYQCNHRPDFVKMRMRREMMMKEGRRPSGPDFGADGHKPGGPDEFRKPDGEGNEFRKPDGEGPIRPWRGMEPGRQHPPVMLGQHDIISIIILILMLGMNLGIKLYFKQRSDNKKLDSLEKQSLEQQLEYLKYQINPHFFMNTLNNIHALVDIDPEKAKETILELSKMMRFVLYEGNKKGVPLDREIAFLQNYVTLMRLRYTDKVRITVDIPATLPRKEVPPLMFITFVENAFKHGVSYRQASFISIRLKTEDSPLTSSLTFTCSNSKIPKEEDKHGGVGLTNVKQRLDLIYGKDYTLDIKDEAATYTVNLTIPL